MDQRNKIGNAYVSEKGSHRQLSDIVYADYMAKTLLERPRPPKPNVPTHFNGKPIAELSASEKDEFYISMQCPSTQATLRRDPKDDENYLSRPLPLNWKADPDADFSTEAGRDKAVAKRALDPSEVQVVQSNRHSQRNTLGDSKDASSVTPEKKEKAVWAYTYSKPADLAPEELKRVKKMDPMENAATAIEVKADDPKPKRSLLQLLGDLIMSPEVEFRAWLQRRRDANRD